MKPAEKPNIIFCDLDEVLNTENDSVARTDAEFAGRGKRRDQFGQMFCPKACRRLENLCRITKAKVVISSFWRSMGIDKLCTMFRERGINVEIIGITPRFWHLGRVKRGEEVAAWLKSNLWNDYVILDDDTDFLKDQLANFVHTKSKDGFNEHCLRQALRILLKDKTEAIRQTIAKITPLKPVLGVTTTSLYFRFKSQAGHEVHMEVLHEPETKEDKRLSYTIEAVATIYKNQDVTVKHAGTYQNVLQAIIQATKN